MEERHLKYISEGFENEGSLKNLLSSPKKSDKKMKDVSKFVRGILGKMSNSSSDTLLLGSLVCYLMGMISGEQTYIQIGNKMRSGKRKDKGDNTDD